MIKCNVTVCGIINCDATTRTNKEGKPFFTFPLQIMVPATDGQGKPVEIDVSKDGGQEEASCYRKGSRVEIDGTMYLKHRGDRTYFNLFANEKVADGFEYQWVRFFCFNRQREEWLQPGVKIDAKGEMGLTVHNGKPNVSCRVEELTQCVADSSNSNQ